ncbi:potassium channel family protein [Haloarcula onubensis]|uniref:TrkA family potassium uptake protein n=1 Tax=Haloarcula onubensis TaxID=2950539 RepID=A0ABU2FRH3_9EURY|nr:TrkA family potassium uptake protein [Halomicroarcula sp. S3CR25-11]MDS0283360.1 TrkA family potassium uptake protein [Halomicroarcula sp. S3CR25-11]
MTRNLRVVIAGGGRVGLQTARLLVDRGDHVVLVERDESVVDDVASEWLATVINGDATHPDILRQADVGRADVVAGLTGQSGVNLAICMAAAELNPGVRTVARIDEAADDTYTQLVDAVVFPEGAGAKLAVNEIVGSDIQSLSAVTSDLDIMFVRVAADAPAAGKELTEVRFPAGTLVISDGDSVATPDLTLEPGERYLVAVEPGVADEVVQLLRG